MNPILICQDALPKVICFGCSAGDSLLEQKLEPMPAVMGATGVDSSFLSLLTTDELGFVKVIQSASQSGDDLRCVRRWGKADKSQGIERLALLPAPHAGEGLAAVGRRHGGIDILSCQHGSVHGAIPAQPCARADTDADAGAIAGLSFWRDDSSLRLLSCTRGGRARLHEHGGEQVPDDAGLHTTNGTWKEIADWEVAKHPVCCTEMEKEAGLLAVGCQGSELSIWNVHTREKVFQAKGAKPNKLGLMDLPWNSALTFVPGAAGKKLFVGTGYHKLRVYDVAQARPVSNVEFGEARISDIAACPDGKSCWAADATGRIQILDARIHKPQSSLKGAGGAVKSISLHPSRPLLASVGLDRHLRIHDTRTKQCLAKLYLKQILTAVKFWEGQGSLEPQPVVDSAVQDPPLQDTAHPAKLQRFG